MGLAMIALALGITITAFPHIRQHSERLALWLLALTVVGCVTTLVEQGSVMSMLSLSEAYTQAGAAQDDLFQALRGVVASARRWMHYINLIVAGSEIALFYATLYAFRFVPRLLAALGIVAALLQMTALIMPFFGQSVNFALIAPLGLMQLLLALWLLVKGFQGK